MEQNEGIAETFQGFLQKSSEETWVLCDAPNLKSCCLKQHTIVTLEGNFSDYPKETVVMVQGIYDDTTNTLSHVSVKEMHGSFPFWTIGAVIFLFGSWAFFKRKLKRPPLP